MVCSAGYFGPARLRVLVAEPDPALSRQIAAALAAGLLNAEVEVANDLETAEKRLRGSSFSAVVAALGMGRDTASRLRPLTSGPLLMIGGAQNSQALLGADDYLAQPFDMRTLMDRLAARLAAVPRAENTAKPGPIGFERFIGTSPAMVDVYRQIERVAASNAPVFITGESGTGKELAAEAVHARSARSGAFIALNCAAIPRELIESEIFGHMRGAFTGAVDEHTGAAEAAHGGTLFLDEIGEMDLSLQTKLLRFVQTGEIRRVGGTKTRTVDVRIVCATNRDPKTEVREGRFREDLFYRLHVLPISLPPLRSRGEDINLLASVLLKRISGEEGRSFSGFDPLAQRLMAAYSWPGNVRELEACLRRVVVLNHGGMVTADMLPTELTTEVLGRTDAMPRIAATPHIIPMWQQEERIIEEALAAFGGNIARAAAALEINPSTIYRRRQNMRKAG